MDLSEKQTERVTLADKLLASRSGKMSKTITAEDFSGKATDELMPLLEKKERSEKELIDRIGRKLSIMLATVRES